MCIYTWDHQNICVIRSQPDFVRRVTDVLFIYFLPFPTLALPSLLNVLTWLRGREDFLSAHIPLRERLQGLLPVAKVQDIGGG